MMSVSGQKEYINNLYESSKDTANFIANSSTLIQQDGEYSIITRQSNPNSTEKRVIIRMKRHRYRMEAFRATTRNESAPDFVQLNKVHVGIPGVHKATLRHW